MGEGKGEREGENWNRIGAGKERRHMTTVVFGSSQHIDDQAFLTALSIIGPLHFQSSGMASRHVLLMQYEWPWYMPPVDTDIKTQYLLLVDTDVKTQYQLVALHISFFLLQF